MRRLKSLLQILKRDLHSKRKFPLDPDHAKKLPVFQYAVSEHTRNRIYVWGNVKTGALGVPYLKRSTLRRVDDLPRPKRLHFAEINEITTVGCGFGYTLFAVKTDGGQKLFGTGLNADSQIGHHEIRTDKPLGVVFFPQPIYLPFKDPAKTAIRKIAAGRAHSAILTDEGLFTFGNNTYGQCGREIVDGEDYTRNKYVHHVADIDGVRFQDVVCGQDHTLALMQDGSVYSCGWSADGQTGLGHFDNTSRLTRVKGDIAGEKIVKIACRSDFVLAINDKGDLFGWGNTEYGQLATSDNLQQICNPLHVGMAKNLGKIVDADCGGSFCLALNEDGRVFVWGFGLLGIGPEVQQSTKPLEIPMQLFGRNDFNPSCRVKSVNCGLSHMAAVTDDGNLYVWGKNRSGCLGLGHDRDQYFPLKVSMSAAVSEVHCGFDHTIAVCNSYLSKV